MRALNSDVVDSMQLLQYDDEFEHRLDVSDVVDFAVNYDIVDVFHITMIDLAAAIQVVNFINYVASCRGIIHFSWFMHQIPDKIW